MPDIKHTPGPWSSGVQTVYGADDVAVAKCTIPKRSHEECAGNARLMAAPPELLETVEELLEWLDQFEGESRVPADVYHRAWNRVIKAKEGETS